MSKLYSAGCLSGCKAMYATYGSTAMIALEVFEQAMLECLRMSYAVLSNDR
jgi:hypothetical protein